MSDDPTDPITGVCIVADPYKCPPRYDLIYRSNDRKDDCDLWKDGVFKAKVTRYICYTRAQITDGGCARKVLTDVIVQNEKEYPPPGFQLIERTQDSLDKATNKRQISVKMVDRHLANEAIIDLIVMSRTRRPPLGYAIAGEINGLMICYKLCTLTSQQKLQQPLPQQSDTAMSTDESEQRRGSMLSQEYQTNCNGQMDLFNSYFKIHAVPAQSQVAPSSNQDINLSPNPMAGVPFQLNSKFVDISMLKEMSEVNLNFPFKSLTDIENEFAYGFTLEKTAIVQRSP